MLALSRRLLAAGSQLLGTVLAERLQQAVPGRVAVRFGDDDRLVHELGQQVKDLPVLDAIAGADCFGRLQCPPAGEH
jgi:hypothetical protein